MPSLKTLFRAGALVLIGAAVHAETAPTPRLGRDVVPTSQQVDLKVDPTAKEYSGSVRIDLEGHAAVQTLRLNARDITVVRAVLDEGRGPAVTKHAATEAGLLTLDLAAPLAPGKHVLAIDFTAPFGTRAVGLYRMEKDGVAYAFTQFEAADARAAFPCWDEPEFKIPFQVTVQTPEANRVVANNPIDAETVRDGWRTARFVRTPPLPTYLVALAVGPFEFVPIPGLSIPGRIVTPKGETALTAEAVRITPAILVALEKWFGRPYPYAKLDLIAVPEYWAGAMENPGAITYSEGALLIDSQRASTAERARLVRYTAHELAHMWFGDLVTMRWWNDLWLNESFADWMGDKITDEVHPEYGEGLSALSRIEDTMDEDARPSAVAIHRAVSDPEDAMRSVGVTYDKGKSVLGMFEHWLGPETFRKGVNDYVKAHEWGNAEASDLWKALSGAAGRDVGAPMASFFDQPGLPLVSVELAPGGLRLSQRRMLRAGDKAPDVRWQVPVALRWSDGKATHDLTVLLTEATQTVPLPATPAWVMPNADARGYYRWSVPASMLQALARAELDVREKVDLISDAGALVQAGELHADAWLDMLQPFAQDPAPEVTSALLDAVDSARTGFVTPALQPAFARYVRTLFAPALARLGRASVPGEDPRVALLRPRVLVMIGEHGEEPDVLAWATAQAQAFLKDPASADGALLRTSLALAARKGDAALFDAYLQRLKGSPSPAVRSALLAALGSFEEPALQDRARAFALSAEVRPNELFTVSRPANADEASRERYYQWMTAHFADIAKRLPPPYLAFMPYAAGGCSPQRLQAAQAFFAQPEHSVDGTVHQMESVADQVNGCVRLREREGQAVSAWLTRQGSASSAPTAPVAH